MGVHAGAAAADVGKRAQAQVHATRDDGLARIEVLVEDVQLPLIVIVIVIIILIIIVIVPIIIVVEVVVVVVVVVAVCWATREEEHAVSMVMLAP